jgi:hypothetical protein
VGRTSIVYIDSAVLERVESKLGAVLHGTGATAILLIDRSGLVLASQGDMPLNPDDMGAVAAGTFSAMRTIIRASRDEEFIVRIPGNSLNLQFREVDHRVFLLAFYSDSGAEESVRSGLAELAEDACNSLTQDRTEDRRMDNLSFIGERLSDILEKKDER